MALLTITSLRVDYRNTEGWFDGGKTCCPFIIVNCVFKCSRTEEDYDYTWNQAKAWSEEYSQKLTIDDPKRYEDWIVNHWDLSKGYDGYGKAWTHEDAPWRYLEKFDCFWFREWIADCGPTRAIIAELQHFKDYGKLPSVYRSVEEGIILMHLRTLHSYWD
jgi:hypothetical protein